MIIEHLKQERLARFLLVCLFVIVAAGMVVGWRWYDEQNSTIHATIPENGGWTPDTITARVGEPLQLRLTSDDMMHSFMVGRLDMEPVDIPPGEITEINLHFDEPGTYTFYCTRICSPTHWRMRGTIEVLGEETELPTPAEPPLYVTLGMDIDAPHPAEVIPDKRPSPTQGAALDIPLPADYQNRDVYEGQSPAQVWQQLRNEQATANLSDAQVWDLVSAIWQAQTDQATLQTGQELYTANCVSCHGPDGTGEGPFATLQATAVPDFTDPVTMLGANSAILQGKLLRGGMGTGMPNFGTIFTDEEIWALVDYLWAFQLTTKDVTE